MHPPQMPYFNSTLELNKIPLRTCAFSHLLIHWRSTWLAPHLSYCEQCSREHGYVSISAVCWLRIPPLYSLLEFFLKHMFPSAENISNSGLLGNGRSHEPLICEGYFFLSACCLCQSGDLVSLQRSSVCQPGTWSAGPLTPYSRHWRSISKTLRPNQTTQNLTSDTGEKPPSLHDKQLSQTSHRARKWVNCVPHISVSPNKETHNDGVTNIS